MSVPLSNELRQAIADRPGELLELVDGSSNARYVLVPADQFDRIKALVGAEDFTLEDTYCAQSEALAQAGWDDPELDVYNDYDGHRQ